jgi:uncharacterized membrane protein
VQHISRSVTINRPRAEVYECWRDLDNLPRVIPEIESVTPLGGRIFRWVIKGPKGVVLEWDAEMTADEPGSLLAWRTVEGASVENQGEVRFADAPPGRGTELRVTLHFNPPAGTVGKAVAAWLGDDPEATVREALRRYKQVLETGEVVRSDGSPHGAGHGLAEQRPAQPAAAEVAS